MLKKIEKIYDEKVINWFYILLPLVEVMTTYMVLHCNTSIPVGVVYKTLYLGYCIGYLVFFDKEKRALTLSVLGLFLVSTVINFFVTEFLLIFFSPHFNIFILKEQFYCIIRKKAT